MLLQTKLLQAELLRQQRILEKRVLEKLVLQHGVLQNSARHGILESSQQQGILQQVRYDWILQPGIGRQALQLLVDASVSGNPQTSRASLAGQRISAICAECGRRVHERVLNLSQPKRCCGSGVRSPVGVAL